MQENMHKLLSQRKLPFDDLVVMRSLQSQFVGRFTEIARRIQSLVDSVNVSSLQLASTYNKCEYEEQICIVALEFLEAHGGSIAKGKREGRMGKGEGRMG